MREVQTVDYYIQMKGLIINLAKDINVGHQQKPGEEGGAHRREGTLPSSFHKHRVTLLQKAHSLAGSNRRRLIEGRGTHVLIAGKTCEANGKPNGVPVSRARLDLSVENVCAAYRRLELRGGGVVGVALVVEDPGEGDVPVAVHRARDVSLSVESHS